jgi:hypothetical protein
MLRRDLIDACAAGRFAVYAIGTIDEGIDLLTGLAPGERDGAGKYPDGTINGLVEARLRGFASVRRRFSGTDGVPNEGKRA